MPNVTYISHQGETHTVNVPVGTSVMEGAVKNGIDGIVAECGGACMCATCHVYVDPSFLDKLPPIGEDGDGRVSGEQPAPQQQRAFLSTPPGRELVRR